jgi:hypothetical protein
MKDVPANVETMTMQKLADADGFRLNSGREINANMGLLSVREGDTTLYEGFDGAVYEDPDSEEGNTPLTKADRTEIAEYMMGQWLQWAMASRPTDAA